MAPPRAGPTRKSHTKSRKGCRTCKARHIRCDEHLPQCKNCTKHNVRCDYMDSPPPGDERTASPPRPNLLSTPRIVHDIDIWQRTGVFPFPEMNLQSTRQFHGLSPSDLHLIHHLSSIYRDMRLADFVGCTIWVQQLPSFFDAAYEHDFVMSSILAFSATHMAWLTNSVETKNIAYYHRGIAFKGLQEAIGNFSRNNSDAALAASILLSWQASDWGGWTSLMQGISTLISSMSPWQHISRFSRFISDHPAFFLANSAAMSFDDQSLFMASNALLQLSARLPNFHPLTTRLHEIVEFAQGFQSSSASMQSERLFEKLQPLREWLFWMPVNLVKANDMGSSAMILLAQVYTLALSIDSSIPELSGAALGSLTVHAIERLDAKLRYKHAVATPGEMLPSELDNLMQFARLLMTRNRLDETLGHDLYTTRTDRQASPYSFHRLSTGSMPGTPNYPPPGSPGLLHAFPSSEDLSIPPSPFLNYGVPVSRRHSQLIESSPRPSEHSFDNRSHSANSIKGESPAYSPAAYSPAFLPELPDDEAWNFGASSPGYLGGFVSSALWT